MVHKSNFSPNLERLKQPHNKLDMLKPPNGKYLQIINLNLWFLEWCVCVCEYYNRIFVYWIPTICLNLKLDDFHFHIWFQFSSFKFNIHNFNLIFPLVLFTFTQNAKPPLASWKYVLSTLDKRSDMECSSLVSSFQKIYLPIVREFAFHLRKFNAVTGKWFGWLI